MPSAPSRHGVIPPSHHAPWSSAQRAAFRAVFAYFAMFAAASLLDVGAAPRALLAAIHDPVVGWVGHVLLRLAGSPRDAGAAWAIAQLLSAVVAALSIAAVWSLVSKRDEYHRLNGWFRIGLRYYIAVIMLVYGGLKVIDSQFPPIPLDQLDRPVGMMSPMALLWTYMGYSSLYSSFAGFGESLGGFLLFFRRTTTAGALILVAVTSNVALINYAYDVPVKQLSFNLLLGAAVLAAGDLRRLIDVFLRNAPTVPADLCFPLGRAQRAIRRVVKPVVVVLATCGPLGASFVVHRSIGLRSALYGVYDVQRFTRNGQVLAPLATDSSRWRRVIFSAPATMFIRSMADDGHVYMASVDTVRHRVTAQRRDDATTLDLGYTRPDPAHLELRGKSMGDSVDVVLERRDERALYRLLRR